MELANSNRHAVTAGNTVDRTCKGCATSIEHMSPDATRCRKGCGRNTNKSRNRKRDLHIVPFVGIDGEGVDRECPDHGMAMCPPEVECNKRPHDYNLLSIGNESLHLPDGGPLSIHAMFKFIWDYHCAHRTHVMVGFFLGYDYSQILGQLPESRARMLYTKEGVAARRRKASGGNPVPFPVRWRGWEFDMLGDSKRFKLRREGASHWAIVCDAGPFFQMPFLSAIDPAAWPKGHAVCSDEEYRLVAEGKAIRSRDGIPRGTPVAPETILYNRLENTILARLMAKQNEGLTSFGVRLHRDNWYGPGQAAQAWLLQTAPEHQAKFLVDEIPADVLQAAQASYYGGRFEVATFGKLPGVTWEYDISSAYPAIIAELPCLLHGEWSQSPGGAIELVYATVVSNSRNLGAVPHRAARQGSISFPAETTGWYWAHELQAAQRANLVVSVDITDQWSYQPCDCPPPFAAVRELYKRRVRDGGLHKDGPEGKALKLVYNSAYGKFAQSIGMPRFANPVYASLITAGCRSQILDAIATHPEGAEAVVMIATDGVYFSSRHTAIEIDPTKPLGGWEESPKLDMTILKPGVYWSGTGHLKVKSRGINQRALSIHIGEFDRQWDTMTPTPLGFWPTSSDDWPRVTIPVEFMVISPRLALHLNKWAIAGQIVRNRQITQTAFPGHKRFLGTPWVDRPELIRTMVPSRRDDEIISTPYDRSFGIEYEAIRLTDNPLLEDCDLSTALRELIFE